MRKVAIVDDNKLYRNLQQDELAQSFEVSTFTSCEEFFTNATNHRYDLIILDRHFDNCPEDHEFHDAFKPEFLTKLQGTQSEGAKILLWTDDKPETDISAFGFNFFHSKQIIDLKKVEGYLK